MAMQLDQVVPFGRSLDEYQAMFTLSPNDLANTIIDVAGGPASFNAEMQARGKRVRSVDPLYAFSAAEIEQRFYAIVDGIMQQVKETPADWGWAFHQSPEQLREHLEFKDGVRSDRSPGRPERRKPERKLTRKSDLASYSGCFQPSRIAHQPSRVRGTDTCTVHSSRRHNRTVTAFTSV